MQDCGASPEGVLCFNIREIALSVYALTWHTGAEHAWHFTCLIIADSNNHPSICICMQSLISIKIIAISRSDNLWIKFIKNTLHI